MFQFAYQLALHFIAMILLLKSFWRRFFGDGMVHAIGQKLGKGFPLVIPGKGPVVWVHAVSFGETKAVAPLVEKIKQELPDSTIVLSTSTTTGHEEGKRSLLQADHHVYLPFDLFWIVNPILRSVKPDLVILAETDFWYTFQHTARELGAQVVVVSGKLSQRSLKGYQRLSWLSRRLFKEVDLFCVQNALYADRFRQLGVSPSKIMLTGNLKFDSMPPAMDLKEREAWQERLGLDPNQPVLIIGSTHDPEEKLLLGTLETVWKQFPTLKVVLVPRHPERFNVVAELLDDENITYHRYSAGPAKGDEQVVLIDAMGKLRQCYQLATIAIVAGSFSDRIGGHNVMEPSEYGIPVLFGPHMFSQPEMTDLMLHSRAGIQIPAEALTTTLVGLLDNSQRRRELGDNGKRLAHDLRGALPRTWELVKPLVVKEKALPRVALKETTML